MTTQVSIQAMLMAVVGGAQTFLGPVVGAALLLVLTLNLPAAETQGMVFGGILVTVLLFAPRGLLGTNWKALLRGRSSGRGTAGVQAAPAVSGPAVAGSSATDGVGS
jgi:branched-chain amino acid transport system permease protein